MENSTARNSFKSKLSNILKFKKGQARAALTFLLVVLILIGLLAVAFSPMTPKILYQTLSRFCLSALDTSDNGVSDYYPIYSQTDAYEKYAISILPDVPGCYTFAADYIRFLNRNYGVKTIVLNITSEAAGLLNSGLGSVIDDRYYDLTDGSFYASREFENFISDIAILNSTLVPDEKVSFVGIKDNPVEEYGNTEKSLLLLSRSEAHEDGAVCQKLRANGYEFLLTDILCSEANTSSDGRYSDIKPPFLSEGTYIFNNSELNWVKEYFKIALSVSGKKTEGFSAINGPEGDFCIIIAGSVEESLSGELFD